MRKNPLVVLSLLFLIASLTLLTYWRFQKMRNALEESGPPQFEEFLITPLEKLRNWNLQNSSETTTQEFISSDGRLRINYPNDWVAMESAGNISPAEWTEKYRLKTLFWAQSLSKEFPAQLQIYQGELNAPLPDIIEGAREAAQKQGWEAEIKKLKIEETEADFEIKYRLPAGNSLYSGGRILAGEGNKFYLVNLGAPGESWANFHKEIDLILKSATVIDR